MICGLQRFFLAALAAGLVAGCGPSGPPAGSPPGARTPKPVRQAPGSSASTKPATGGSSKPAQKPEPKPGQAAEDEPGGRHAQPAPSPPAPPPKPSGPLDGHTYRIRLTENKVDVGTDMLRFSDLHVTSDFGRARAFEKARYTFSAKPSGRRGPTVRFEATQKSPTEGAIHWTGSTRGDRVDGRAEWKRKSGTIKYRFTGKRVKAPK